MNKALFHTSKKSCCRRIKHLLTRTFPVWNNSKLSPQWNWLMVIYVSKYSVPECSVWIVRSCCLNIKSKRTTGLLIWLWAGSFLLNMTLISGNLIFLWIGKTFKGLKVQEVWEVQEVSEITGWLKTPERSCRHQSNQCKCSEGSYTAIALQVLAKM